MNHYKNKGGKNIHEMLAQLFTFWVIKGIYKNNKTEENKDLIRHFCRFSNQQKKEYRIYKYFIRVSEKNILTIISYLKDNTIKPIVELNKFISLRKEIKPSLDDLCIIKNCYLFQNLNIIYFEIDFLFKKVLMADDIKEIKNIIESNRSGDEMRFFDVKNIK